MRNKKILVLQFRTDKSLEHEIECICKAGGYTKDELYIVNVLDEKRFVPKPEELTNYKALITAASGQFNVTDWPVWVQRRVKPVVDIFNKAIELDFPTLAICFGFQVVAQLLGGKVERDDSQAETGTYKIYLTKEGRNSKLFKQMPKDFFAVLGHKDSVTKLPRNAVKLAYSDKCGVEAYRLGNNFYGLQFHPELDLDGLIWRLKLYPEYLKGKSLVDIRSEYSEIVHATKVVENFKALVDEYWDKRV